MEMGRKVNTSTGFIPTHNIHLYISPCPFTPISEMGSHYTWCLLMGLFHLTVCLRSSAAGHALQPHCYLSSTIGRCILSELGDVSVSFSLSQVICSENPPPFLASFHPWVREDVHFDSRLGKDGCEHRMVSDPGIFPPDQLPLDSCWNKVFIYC